MKHIIGAVLVASSFAAALIGIPNSANAQVVIIIGNGSAQPYYPPQYPYPYPPPYPHRVFYGATSYYPPYGYRDGYYRPYGYGYGYGYRPYGW